MKTSEPFILHIWEAIEKIERYTNNYNVNLFLQDDKTHDAVIRQLEIIGEATTHLETDFRKQLQTINWQEIKAFRNRIAHAYWDIDLDLVWGIVKNHLPELKQAINPIYQQIEKDTAIEDW